MLRREGFFAESFVRHQRALVDLGVLGTTLTAVRPLVLETCFVVGALLVAALVTVTGSAGPDGLPLLGLFAYAGFRVVPALNRVTWRVNEIRGNGAAVRDLYEDYAAVAPLADRDPARAPADAPASRWERISLDRVSFQYPGAGRGTIDDVSLDVRRGEMLGIVGPTGAGKTTLADLLLGLFQPSAGVTRVDGVDLSSTARPRAAYVPQSVFVADDTIARNVAFGLREREHVVDASRVARAIRAAQLETLVATLRDGTDTMVGERGSRLSGGERQRLGIARALYHDPDLLVLDEATSALDIVTEDRVLNAIRTLRDTAVVIVAHRLSTLRHCDRLVLLLNGRVAAAGAFDQLMATSPEFRELVEVGELALPGA